MTNEQFRVTKVFLVLCLFAAACATPAAPKVSYAGEWAGATSQGEPITFTISADETVTSITAGYAFNGCRGSKVFANLNVSIAPQVVCLPGPCSGPVSSYRAFSYQSGDVIQEPTTEVHGSLFAGTNAQGTMNFRNYPACGDAIGVAWSATRRK